MKPMSKWTDRELRCATHNHWGNRMGAAYAEAASEELKKRETNASSAQNRS